MDCASIDRLLDRWLDEELSPDQARALTLHLESCPDCSARAAATLDLFRSLDALPTPRPPAGLRRRILAAVRQERDRFNVLDWWRSLGAAARGGALALALAGVLLGGVLSLSSGISGDVSQAQGPYLKYLMADNGDWL